MKPEINKIVWLVKEVNDSAVITLGFLRDHKDGAFIIGGETGSHYTGHDEGWNDKWDELVSSGYIPVNTAKEKGVLDSAWSPPKINKDDQKVVDKINKKFL